MNETKSIYFSEINKIPLLTLEEEKKLAVEAHNGNKAAFDRLVNSNLRFVMKIANQYKGYMDIEDLIAEGNLGLIHAAEKYNPESNNRFVTYAVWWIKAYIQKAIREVSTGVRFPATRFEEMKSKKWQIASLDKELFGKDGDEVSLLNFQEEDKYSDAEEQFIKEETLNDLYNMVEGLEPKEKTVIVKRYGLDGEKPMSLSQIGTLMGFSKERIRQLELKAIKSLRMAFIEMDLPVEDFLAA